MAGWDYKVIKIQPDRADTAELEQTLKSLGREGWEVVFGLGTTGVTDDECLRAYLSFRHGFLIMKRPL